MTIVVADDHPIVRQGIRRVIERRVDLRVVAEADSGLSALDLVAEHQPDAVILDIGMKGLNGLEAAGRIHKRHPNCRILMLTMHADERYVRRAFREGAAGYVLKDSLEGELVEALSALRRGERFVSPALGQWAGEETAVAAGPEDRYDLLTERERHIYQLLAEGNGNKDIANMLELSLHTVETHRARIMDKLGARNAADLVLSAFRRGVVR